MLAFDFGEKRIGVAVGQDLTRSARPLATVGVRGGRPDWEAIARLVETWQPDLLVLGRPLTADGAAHPLAAALERFARRLRGRFARPVAFVDERLSSWAAAEAGGSAGPGGLDAAAAGLILETWFAENPTP